MQAHRVDVIIPAYKPDDKLIRCLELLGRQTHTPSNIYIVNTGKSYYDSFMAKRTIPAAVRSITTVIHIPPEEFDHGGTRRAAVMKSDAEYFLMMTQDAVPYDEDLVAELIRPLDLDDHIAVSYARQLPSSDASATERYVRGFNYPREPMVKSMQDLPLLGVKTYFCSNVCAAYRRSSYDEAGGFIERTIFNEDMILAAALIKKGYAISYTANAKVYHSHNYTCRQQFKRNFDIAVSQMEHPEVFRGLSSEDEGVRLVKGCIRHLAESGRPYLIPGFIINCAARFMGFRAGKKYKYMPAGLRKALSSQPSYWD